MTIGLLVEGIILSQVPSCKMFTGIDAKEVEKFSSLFKSQSVKTNFVFEIVSGYDIKNIIAKTLMRK
jgi:hypothetical protein